MNTNRNNLFTRKGELCALRGPTREKGSSHVHTSMWGLSQIIIILSLSSHDPGSLFGAKAEVS